MSLDTFFSQYVRLLNAEIESKRDVLAEKQFSKRADFTRVQGELNGLQTALNLLRAIPEE